MSDHIFAYYDADRDAVVIRMESGSEVSVMDVDDASCFADEVRAAANKESSGYDEFLAAERGEDDAPTDTQTDTQTGACILTDTNMASQDDCTTHDHEPVEGPQGGASTQE